MTDVADLVGAGLTAHDLEHDPVAVLAAVVAAPPLVTWAHLRQARRSLDLPLQVELNLLDSDLTEGTTDAGLALTSHFRRDAREAVREVFAGVDDVAEVLTPPRGDLSPLLESESDLVVAFMTEENFVPTTSRILRDILLTLAVEDRRGIRTWVSGAVSRLPLDILQTSTGYLLRRVVGMTGGRVEGGELDPLDLALVRDLADLLPTRLVAFVRDGNTLVLGPPSRRRASAIRIPSLAGVGIRADWSVDGSARNAVLDLNQFPVELPTGRSEVTLTTVLDERYVLPAFDEVPAPEDVQREAGLDLVEQAWRDGGPLKVHAVRAVKAGTVVEFVDAPTVQAIAIVSLGRELVEGSETMVVVREFRRGPRFVVVEQLPPPSLDPGTVMRGVVVATPKTGFWLHFPGGHRGFLPNREIDSGRLIRMDDSLEVEVLGPTEPQGHLPVGLHPRRPAHVPPRKNAFRDDEERGVFFAEFFRQHPMNTEIHGIVQSVVEFGVFVELNSGLVGLLHSSEIGPGTNLREGDDVPVKVLDVTEGRVAFCLHPRVTQTWTGQLVAGAKNGPTPMSGTLLGRALLAQFADSHPEGTRVVGTVNRVVNFGAFVALPHGVGGLLHNTEIPAGVEPRIGDELSLVVVKLDERGVGVGMYPRIAPGAPTRLISVQTKVKKKARTKAGASEVLHVPPVLADPDVIELWAAHTRRIVGGRTAEVTLDAVFAELWKTTTFRRPKTGFKSFRAFVAWACPGVEIAKQDDGTLFVRPWRAGGA